MAIAVLTPMGLGSEKSHLINSCNLHGTGCSLSTRIMQFQPPQPTCSICSWTAQSQLMHLSIC